MKTCTKCKQEKEKSEFGKNSRNIDGLQTYCKKCMSSYNDKRTRKTKDKNILSLNHKPKADLGNPLSEFTSRELIAEIKRRGFDGQLTYTNVVDLSTL